MGTTIESDWGDTQLKKKIESLQAERDELSKEVIRHCKTIDSLQAELLEQCRLNGMGAEREANLMGEVERLKADNERLKRFANQADTMAKEVRAEAERLKTQLSGQTCYVPPEFQNEMDALREEVERLKATQCDFTITVAPDQSRSFKCSCAQVTEMGDALRAENERLAAAEGITESFRAQYNQVHARNEELLAHIKIQGSLIQECRDALLTCKPLAGYGRVGSKDSDQKNFQDVINNVLMDIDKLDAIKLNEE